MVKSLLRITALLFVVCSLACCSRGFRAGSGVYITNVKISSMPKPVGVAAPELAKTQQPSAPIAHGAVVASAAAPAIVR